MDKLTAICRVYRETWDTLEPNPNPPYSCYTAKVMRPDSRHWQCVGRACSKQAAILAAREFCERNRWQMTTEGQNLSF